MKAFTCLWLLISTLLCSSLTLATPLPLPVSPDNEMPSLAPIVEKVAPAVVSISIFDEKGRSIGVGSGVIVDAEEGLLLSNHHVVSKAKRIQVTLTDGRDFDAELIGTDPAVDLALLKINASHLTALPLVDSDQLRVGDYVLAIGNPFGLGHSVSSGIVSALDRTGLGLEHYENFIQVDATINPGNSGGALINLRGELVGINTAVVAPKGGNSVGIGFAIPSNVAKTISMHLARSGQVSRGRMGVSVQDLSETLKNALQVPADVDGVVITAIKADSAAEKAGLQVGDVITRINDRVVDSMDNIRARMGLLTLNPELTIDYLRAGQPHQMKVLIHPSESAQAGKIPVLHFGGATLSEDPDKPGLRVRSLTEGSPAESSGLMKNDLILQLNYQKVQSLQDFAKFADAKSNLMLLQRGPSTLFIVLEAPARD